MLRKLNFKRPSLKIQIDQLGVLHHIIPLAVVVLFGVVGVGYVVETHAATPGPISPVTVTAKMPFGIYESGNNGQYSFPTTPNYAIQYYGWGEGFQSADATAAHNMGTELFAELQTCGNPCDVATSTPITDVTAGKYDSYLKSFAQSIASYKYPVLVTFDHEMNGDWYPWGTKDVTASQYIAAWQHVTSLMSTYESNATFVWAPNIEEGASSVATYWPGNGYKNAHVDDVGLDGYYQNTGSTWTNTFSKSVSDIRKLSGNRELLVAETGVPSADSNNVSQINNLVSGAKGAGVNAVMYFDTGNWSFTSAGQSAFVNDVK